MLKKSVIILSVIFCNLAWAETCPTLSEIKSHQLSRWHAMDFGSAGPASKEKIEHFFAKATHLVAVSWDFSEYGRCFYAGKNEQPDQLGVFLEKTTEPDKSRGNWHYSDPDSWLCNGNLNDCAFKTKEL